MVTNYRVIDGALWKRSQKPGPLLPRATGKKRTAAGQVLYCSNTQEARKASPRNIQANKLCKTLG